MYGIYTNLRINNQFIKCIYEIVSVMEMHCSFCEVRNEFLNII